MIWENAMATTCTQRGPQIYSSAMKGSELFHSRCVSKNPIVLLLPVDFQRLGISGSARSGHTEAQ